MFTPNAFTSAGLRNVQHKRVMPNTSFQRTLTRGGFGPLNSDR